MDSWQLWRQAVLRVAAATDEMLEARVIKLFFYEVGFILDKQLDKVRFICSSEYIYNAFAPYATRCFCEVRHMLQQDDLGFSCEIVSAKELSHLYESQLLLDRTFLNTVSVNVPLCEAFGAPLYAKTKCILTNSTSSTNTLSTGARELAVGGSVQPFANVRKLGVPKEVLDAALQESSVSSDRKVEEYVQDSSFMNACAQTRSNDHDEDLSLAPQAPRVHESQQNVTNADHDLFHGNEQEISFAEDTKQDCVNNVIPQSQNHIPQAEGFTNPHVDSSHVMQQTLLDSGTMPVAAVANDATASEFTEGLKHAAMDVNHSDIGVPYMDPPSGLFSDVMNDRDLYSEYFDDGIDPIFEDRRHEFDDCLDPEVTDEDVFSGHAHEYSYRQMDVECLEAYEDSDFNAEEFGDVPPSEYVSDVDPAYLDADNSRSQDLLQSTTIEGNDYQDRSVHNDLLGHVPNQSSAQINVVNNNTVGADQYNPYSFMKQALDSSNVNEDVCMPSTARNDNAIDDLAAYEHLNAQLHQVQQQFLAHNQPDSALEMQMQQPFMAQTESQIAPESMTMPAAQAMPSAQAIPVAQTMPLAQAIPVAQAMPSEHCDPAVMAMPSAQSMLASSAVAPSAPVDPMVQGSVCAANVSHMQGYESNHAYGNDCDLYDEEPRNKRRALTAQDIYAAEYAQNVDLYAQLTGVPNAAFNQVNGMLEPQMPYAAANNLNEREFTDFDRFMAQTHSNGAFPKNAYEILPEIDLPTTGKRKQNNVASTQKDEPIICPSVATNPEYTFNSFVCDKKNATVLNSVRAIANNPGNPAHNPLYIYGDSGAGKTHLLNAIVNEMKALGMPENQIGYIRTKDFIRHYVSTISDLQKNRFNNQQVYFHKSFLDKRVLVFDDLQEFKSATKSREVFYGVISAFLDRPGSQLILCANVPPAQLQNFGFDDHLMSLLHSGLCLEVKAPSASTRRLMLDARCEHLHLTMENNVKDYIVSKVSSDVRELDGVLKTLLSLQCNSGVITMNEAVRCMSRFTCKDRQSLSMSDVMDIAAKELNVTVKDILSSRKKKPVSMARSLAMTVIREVFEGKYSLNDIGRAFNKDHSSVHEAVSRTKKRIISDTFMHEKYRNIMQVVKKQLA
ncbi:DnaA ATPase domain-containing protein [uncultured Anaerobiospirillum sp.]|uniref:DnaA ATPase domain-containing protein n=1 Tax=uncultured Anaerobiospirillum sp. TaxID=265728 RepID=UPI0028057AE3|nr:DnaA/Hda family protein [uncultured Anaerobiospirillum sp.]